MTALKNIEKDELTKLLKDSEILVIEGQNLSHLNLGNLDFSGKTLKDCDISDANFGNCAGLPTLVNCTVDREKATDVVVLKSKKGALTIFSMIRGDSPYYMVNGKEYGPMSAENVMIGNARRLANLGC